MSQIDDDGMDDAGGGDAPGSKEKGGNSASGSVMLAGGLATSTAASTAPAPAKAEVVHTGGDDAGDRGDGGSEESASEGQDASSTSQSASSGGGSGSGASGGGSGRQAQGGAGGGAGREIAARDTGREAGARDSSARGDNRAGDARGEPRAGEAASGNAGSSAASSDAGGGGDGAAASGDAAAGGGEGGDGSSDGDASATSGPSHESAAEAAVSAATGTDGGGSNESGGGSKAHGDSASDTGAGSSAGSSPANTASTPGAILDKSPIVQAGPAIDVAPVCFLPGTLIATPIGSVPVERLAPGDLVLTLEGTAEPVRWLGVQTIRTQGADPLRVLPIRIRAGAIAEGMPSRDLYLSPDHAVAIDGVLIHAGALVDGIAVLRETDGPPVLTYHHVELADHRLILAEDVAAESFVDNLERLAFDNWAERKASLGDTPPAAEMALPRAKSARQVPMAVRRHLAARAALLFGAGEEQPAAEPVDLRAA